MNLTDIYKVFLMLLIAVQLKSFAQEKTATDSIASDYANKKSYGLVSTNYYSDMVFLGRKSSSKAPYLSALAGFYHKSGLYMNGGVSYLAASGESRIDLFTLAAGYDYHLKNFSAGIYGTKYFFSHKSYAVKSELLGYAGAYAGYDFHIADVYIDGSVYISNATDFILGAGVSHSFYAAKNTLTITPVIYLSAGTQNYYSNYNHRLRFGQNLMNGGSLSTGPGMMGGGISSFKVQDYELSVPVNYSRKNLRFSFLPGFAIPVNPSTITNSQYIYKEELSNSFFWSVGVSYKF